MEMTSLQGLEMENSSFEQEAINQRKVVEFTKTC